MIGSMLMWCVQCRILYSDSLLLHKSSLWSPLGLATEEVHCSIQSLLVQFSSWSSSMSSSSAGTADSCSYACGHHKRKPVTLFLDRASATWFLSHMVSQPLVPQPHGFSATWFLSHMVPRVWLNGFCDSTNLSLLSPPSEISCMNSCHYAILINFSQIILLICLFFIELLLKDFFRFANCLIMV